MITKEKWAEIIKDFNERKLPEIIKRDIDIPIEIPINRSISLIGPRRAGKTYEMFQIIKKLLEIVKKEQILYINFERADLGIVNSEDLVILLETFFEIYPENKTRKVWLFLDEIQNVLNWEKFVRTSLDEQIKVYLTGSSSKLLSREIATSMRGRNITYNLLPFSFREYLRAKNIESNEHLSSTEKLKILNALKNYMEYGGYPEVVIYESEKEKILTDIKETAIYKDVIERSKIRNINAMRLLITALINSKEFSVNKFYNFLKSSGIKIGKNVLYNYIQYLNDVFFVFTLRKFSYSYKNAEQSIPKIYFIDNGLLRISGITDKGRLMENLVFIQLLRNNLDISYYRSPTNEEVDFIIKDNKKIRQLIQVCYNLNDYITKERELKALLKASKELKCNNLLVITYDLESEEKIKNKKIKFIPLWKWLLEKCQEPSE
jgi:uncharacterized protein